MTDTRLEELGAAGPATSARTDTGETPGATTWLRAHVPTAFGLVACACAVVAVVAIAWSPANGIDPTDEASYLQAVQAPQRSDAFNGFFGLYLRPLWIVTGWDIAAVRLVGLGVLLGVAVLLGGAIARFLTAPRLLVTAATVAASTGFYATSWRTPSYNWLALVGAVLVATGLLHLRAGSPAAGGRSSDWGSPSPLAASSPRPGCSSCWRPLRSRAGAGRSSSRSPFSALPSSRT